MKKIAFLAISLTIGLWSCESYIDDVLPDDQITSATFWNSEADANMALNGIYNVQFNASVFGHGPGWDACTPNAHEWAWWVVKALQIGNGTITSKDGYSVSDRWTYCYRGVNRANYFFENIDRVTTLNETKKAEMRGEAYFLRANFYYLMAKTYGGVPLVTKTLSADEARTLTRASIEDTWAQVHSDYDEAIKVLPKDAATGKATLGAALGMKMKAYLYTSQWDKVFEYCNKIEELGKYSLFPSYHGLFQLENEGNSETIFALSFMSGDFSQGSYFDRYYQPQNLKYNMDGANVYSPTQLLVDAYETIDGSPVDPLNPYVNRDPRLDFTILRPGAYFQGQLYPTEIRNHTGQPVGFSARKYLIETQQVVAMQSPLDYMILRYGDVLLCKAEAMIELNQNIDAAIDIINRIRTERNDVKITAIPHGLSQVAAREVLRKERRIELALEGDFYWDDIKRWNIGPDIYPCVVIGALGQVVETKFPMGYDLTKDNLLPLPDAEISLNHNLIQNHGY
jgi:starch-binding outer membrane protein, SusD/RagB family